MPRYNLSPIVSPADLRGRSIPSHVAEAVRRGTARLVGFGHAGEALALLAAREATRRAYVPDREARPEPARRWVSLADVPGALDGEGGPTALNGRGPRGGGVTGPSRGGA